MVEFAKIIKKARGVEPETPRKAPAKPAPKGRPKRARHESRVDREPERRKPVRREPPPRREPSREESLPVFQEREPREEESLLKPVKPFFSEPRVQEQIKVETSVPDDPVVSGRDEREDGAPLDRSQEQRDEPSRFEALPGSSLSTQEAFALYEELMAVIRDILHKSYDPQQVDARRLTSLMGEVVRVIGSGDERLIELAVTHLLKEEESYLPQHCVNAAILALAIGQGVGYDAGKMLELGLTAFLHDIGMVGYTDMANVPRPLTPKEFEVVKEHVDTGQEMLRQIHPTLSEAVLIAQHEIHERTDGSGYPQGRHSIHEYARIIALADTFESMIHPRPFRSRYSIMDVYKKIFAAKQKYDPVFIKVLVDRLGFFPNGTYIQLNTKEVGRVVAQNRRSPLRPVVRLLYSESGQRLYDDDVKDVNLVRFPTLHVVKCFLRETEGEDGDQAVG